MPMGFEADALRRRRAIRDLVAVSTVPAVWAGREPRAIAAGLVDVLVNALYLDFAFVRLCDPTGVPRSSIGEDHGGGLRVYAGFKSTKVCCFPSLRKTLRVA